MDDAFIGSVNRHLRRVLGKQSDKLVHRTTPGMEGKTVAKLPTNKVFQCSMVCEIGHANGFKNKDEKNIQKKQECQCIKECEAILDHQKI